MDFTHRVLMEPIAQPPEGIHKLMDEILLIIFSHLSLEDLSQSAFVCRRWHSLLKGRKSLWRQRKFTIESPVNYRKMKKMIAIMPQLESVRLILGWRCAIHIAWPEAIVVIGNNALEEMQCHCVFPTDVLLVSSYIVGSVKRFLKWAKPRPLKKIHVGEQCLAPFRDLNCPLSSYMQDDCNIPGCLLHNVEPSFYQIPSSHRRRSLVARKASCPALEQLSVCCMYLSEECLERLCRLGPMRILHVTCHELESLSFLNHCATQLEVLSISRSHIMSSEPVTDLFGFFRELKDLKVIKLSELSLSSHPSEAM